MSLAAFYLYIINSLITFICITVFLLHRNSLLEPFHFVKKKE